MYSISKSKYCKAIQCPKILWMDRNMPEEAVCTASESVLKNGNEVGDLARKYFGEYKLVDFSLDKSAMCKATEEILKKGERIIAEASFMYNNCFCSVDILKKENDGYHLIEVKSSSSIHDIYYYDMAFQYWVLTNCGLKVTKVFNMHINSKYVRKGALMLDGLFTLEDCTQDILKMQGDIAEKLKIFFETAEQETEPYAKIGVHCRAPYDCEYIGYCHRSIPEPSVFSIHGVTDKKKYELYNSGIITFADIVNNAPKLSDNAMKQVLSAYENNGPEINKKAISDFLSTLSYPLYHLDFETFQQAIPQYDGVKPYMQIPFQYSLHVQHSKGAVPKHYEFLGKEGTDPRRALAEQLCRDIPINVCSMAYNMSFEKRVIKELAEQYPDLSAHLMNIHDNMHDLMVPFRNKDYYCKEMEGSYSIKYVLPALCSGDPDLDYHSLNEIHNGGEAMSAFAELQEHSPEEIAETRKNLLAYCRLDTLAMVKVLEKLYEAVK